MFDLAPATGQLAGLVRKVTDGDLKAPTPCPDYTVGDLLDHVNGLSVAFTMAARKTPVEGTAAGDAARLPLDFRESVPARLGELAQSWRSPAAWEGMTRAGGVDLPGEVAGAVALDEMVLHGWDLARATGQDETIAAQDVERLWATATAVPPELMERFRTPGAFGPGIEVYGPEVAVPEDAALQDRLLGYVGRDPVSKSF